MQSAHFSSKSGFTEGKIEVRFDEKEVDGIPIAESVGLFDPEKLSNAIDHANQITQNYGVTVMSINIISAVPRDKDLLRSLAKGAVAAAEAQQLVI